MIWCPEGNHPTAFRILGPMLSIILPLLLAVCGALLYALATNGKLSEMGRIMFFVGLFWLVPALGAARMVHFG